MKTAPIFCTYLSFSKSSLSFFSRYSRISLSVSVLSLFLRLAQAIKAKNPPNTSPHTTTICRSDTNFKGWSVSFEIVSTGDIPSANKGTRMNIRIANTVPPKNAFPKTFIMANFTRLSVGRQLENLGSNNIVVFLTIQYYCLSLRHE